MGANLRKVPADLGARRKMSLQQLPPCGAASAQAGGGGGGTPKLAGDAMNHN